MLVKTRIIGKPQIEVFTDVATKGKLTGKCQGERRSLSLMPEKWPSSLDNYSTGHRLLTAAEAGPEGTPLWSGI